MGWKREAVRRNDQMLHVCNRGVDRSTLFFKEADYLFFLQLLHQGLKDMNIQICAYVLLPNHFHLLLWQRVAYAVSNYMKGLDGVFALRTNKVHSRTGHLFQGRYRIDAIDDPASALRMSWYIHQNPVKAHLVDSPELWRFGSMREYAGLVIPGITTVSRLSDLVGGVDNYLRFMKEYDPSSPGSAGSFLI